MAIPWRPNPFDELEEGIARIRQLSQQVQQARELVAQNTSLLERDRALSRSSPLCEADDLRTHDSQVRSETAVVEDRPARSRRRR